MDEGITASHFGGVSICGASHVRRGLPCQDAFMNANNGSRRITVVSDGAGSASHSDVGAQHFVKTIAAALLNDAVQIGADTLRHHIIKAIEEVKHTLSDTHQLDLREFAGTLLGAVFDNEHCWIFHVGDGAAVVFGLDSEVYISHPENGEYANETFFVTMPNWSEHLRINRVPFKPTAIFVMSDGVTPFALKGEGIASGFLKPISKYLMTATVVVGENALRHLLSGEQATALCDDDKTLSWILCNHG